MSLYTISKYKAIQRPWGWECRFTATSPGRSDINEVVLIPTADAALAAAQERLTVIEARIAEDDAYEAVKDTHFDGLGPEIIDAIKWLISGIRKYPNATYTQVETRWNAEFSDSIFTFARLAVWVQSRVGDVTWDQFKTYVINHKFAFMDR